MGNQQSTAPESGGESDLTDNVDGAVSSKFSGRNGGSPVEAWAVQDEAFLAHLPNEGECLITGLTPPSDSVDYPFDGVPEHDSFISLNGLRLHTYIWYPSAYISRLGRIETVERVESEKEAGRSASIHKNSRPNLSTLAKKSLRAVDFELSDGLPYCRGLIVVLHGFESHTRFSWLSKPIPPMYCRRDPTVTGYVNASETSYEGDCNNVERKNSDTVHFLSGVGETQKKKNRKRSKADEDFDEYRIQSVMGSKTSMEACLSPGTPCNVQQDVGGITASQDSASLVGDASQSGENDCLAAGRQIYVGSWVEQLNKEGFIVAGYDFQGHGLSEGNKGRRAALENLDDLAVDTVCFLQYLQYKFTSAGRPLEHVKCPSDGGDLQAVKEGEKVDERASKESDSSSPEKGALPALPVFLLGSSLGGWAAARALQLLRNLHMKLAIREESVVGQKLPRGHSNQKVSTVGLSRQKSAKSNEFPLQDSDLSVAVDSLPMEAAAPKSRLERGTGVADQKKWIQIFASRPVRLKGCILISPMLSLQAFKRGVRYSITRPILRAASALLPNVAVSNKSKGVYPFLEMYAQQDRYTHKGGVKACTAFELLEGTDRILSEPEMAKLCESPCENLLVIHNLLDTMCEIDGSLRFYEYCDKSAPNLAASFVAVNAYTGGVSAAYVGNEKKLEQTLPPNLYLECNVDKNTLDHLQKFADPTLHGLDVWHSLAYEPDNGKLFPLIKKWIEATLENTCRPSVLNSDR